MAPSPAAPARSYAALRQPGFRAYFVTSALAMMADAIEHVISYWMMFQKFQSPALGGFAIISHWLPFLLFSVWSGALADRFDPRRVVQIGMVLFMGVSIAWGVLFILGIAEVWHAVVLLIVHGFAGVLWMPASQLLVHDIVPPEQLQSAVRLSATARYLGLVGGPAIGSGLMLWLGPSTGILLNALIYLPLVGWLWKAHYGPRFRDGKPPPRLPVRAFSDILATLRAVAHHRIIVLMLILSACASLFVGNGYHPQMPEFAHDLGHGEAGLTYSLLLGADAAGALIAGLVLEARGLLQPRARTALVLALTWCTALAAFSLSSSYALALGLLFVAGFMELSFNAMAQTLVQLQAPAGIRGRVIGLYAMSSLGMRAFSGITIGLLGAAIGIHVSLALSAVALAAIILGLVAFSPRTR